MLRYIVRRSLLSVLLLWLATLMAFSLYQLAPGGPLKFLERDPRAQSGGKNSQFDTARLERIHGLDRAIPVQYLVWLAGEDWLPAAPSWRSGRCLDRGDCSHGILRLDFGRSFYFKGEPVLKVIADRIPATLLLGATSLALAFLIGIPLGVLAALKHGTWIDKGVRAGTVLLTTVPDWWLGLLLLTVLGGYLQLVPLGGMSDPANDTIWTRLHHLLLPAVVAATAGWISLSRIVRAEMLDVMNQDYVRTARGKGLRRRTVVTRHVLRNAILPLITSLSGIFLLLLEGAVLFELIFAWPGMGRLTVTAIGARDYPVLMALFVIGTVLGILGMLLVDILYSIADPRVRYDKNA